MATIDFLMGAQSYWSTESSQNISLINIFKISFVRLTISSFKPLKISGMTSQLLKLTFRSHLAP